MLSYAILNFFDNLLKGSLFFLMLGEPTEMSGEPAGPGKRHRTSSLERTALGRWDLIAEKNKVRWNKKKLLCFT